MTYVTHYLQIKVKIQIEILNMPKESAWVQINTKKQEKNGETLNEK